MSYLDIMLEVSLFTACVVATIGIVALGGIMIGTMLYWLDNLGSSE